MITVEAALKIVLSTPGNFGMETVALANAYDRFLGEAVYADRDAPPFDRVMMDGIAINSLAIAEDKTSFLIESIQAAGDVQKTLADINNCIEVMTGAIVPANTDTVIAYELIELIGDKAFIKQPIEPLKNIHAKGRDHKKDELALHRGKRLNAPGIGLLAAIGKHEVAVYKVPSVAIVATGNELVAVTETPLAHQIRISNAYMLKAALQQDQVNATIFHLQDEEDSMKKRLGEIVRDFDVVLISGGVSQGKYDYVPKILASLGIEQGFHRVAQKPGKPFWFGQQPTLKTTVFAFPGNPIATQVCYQYYFRQWLFTSLGNQLIFPEVVLAEGIIPHKILTQFIPVVLNTTGSSVRLSANSGSGDLYNLAAIDGFIILPNGDNSYAKGSNFNFVKLV